MTWRKAEDRRAEFYDLDIENLDFNRVKQYLSKWSGEVVVKSWMQDKLVKKFGVECDKYKEEQNPWPTFWEIIEDCLVETVAKTGESSIHHHPHRRFYKIII